MSKTRILFTGGGTGGHIYPIIAIVRELRRIYPGNEDLDIFYMGAKDELSLILLSQEGVRAKGIFSGKLRRYFSFQNFIDILFKIPLGVLQSFYYLIRVKPDLIFSKGGYGAVPVILSGRLLGIPIFIHESDVVPGLANKLAAGWAKKIFISFPKTEYFPLEKTILTGNPIRKEITEGSKIEAENTFGLTMQKPIILFLGGSQGAEKINNFILNTLNRLLDDFEIIHQCGPNNYEQTKKEAMTVINEDFKKYYHIYPFLEQDKLKHAYKVADLIVSRAGASSIFEIAANAKPSILIPLPSAAGDHQAKNAYTYTRKGAGVVIEQENLTSNFVLEKLRYLFFYRPQELETMKEQALEFSKPLAAKKIARHIFEYLLM